VEYTSVVWNSIMSVDANWNTFSRSLWPSFNHFFPQVDYSYDLALEQLKLHSLQKTSYHLDALFVTQVYHCSELCPSVLEIVGLRVPAHYIRLFCVQCLLF
jgi:hypothetical protein